MDASRFHGLMEDVVFDMADAGDLMDEIDDEIRDTLVKIGKEEGDVDPLRRYIIELRQIRAEAQNFEV